MHWTRQHSEDLTHRPSAGQLTPRLLPLLLVPLFAFGLLAAFYNAARRWGEETFVQAPVTREGRPWDSAEARALLGIDQHGQYYFNRRAIRNATLATVLDSAFRVLPRGTTLYVWADRDVVASTVQEALAIAREHGVEHAALVAEPSSAR